MAKRFIDTDIFKKQFVRGLDAPSKLFFFYLITDCNHAGIWECDWEVASIRCGYELNKEFAIKNFGNKIYFFDKDNKIFIPSFIDFQYGELNPDNRAHKSVIDILNKYNLNKIKPLISPLQGAMDKDMDLDTDKDMDKVPVLESVVKFFQDNGYKADVGITAWNYYNDANWNDSKGKKVKNWKQKMRGVWFKDENKAPIVKNSYDPNHPDNQW